MQKQKVLALVGFLALVAVACAPAATPSPTPTLPPGPTTTPGATPKPAATAALPTTPVPTATLTATPAPKPPTSAQPQYGGIVRAGVAGAPAGWDFMAIASGGRLNRFHDNLVFNDLFAYRNTPEVGCSLKLFPELAEGYRWLDDLTLEVKVRTGVRFQNRPPVNGREMTINDVAYSIKRLMSKQSRVFTAAQSVKDIQAKDASTLVLTLKEVYVNLPGGGLMSSRYGAHILARESGGPEESWEDPAKSWIGTGPFMFREYKTGVSATYARNPNYWKSGLPYADAVVFQIMPDESTRLAALRSGKLDLIHQDVPIAHVQALKASGSSVRSYACPSGTMFNFWLRSDIPPLNDVRLRRALSMAVDRQAINKAILLGEGNVVVWAPDVPGLLYLSAKDFPPETRKYAEYNPEEARRLLREAGFTQDRPLPAQVWGSAGLPIYVRQMAEALVDAWQAIGVKATLNMAEWAYYTGTVLAKAQYEGATAQGFVVPTDFENLTYFASDSLAQNRGHVSDEQIVRLTREFVKTTDEKKQRELAAQIQLRVVEQAYQISIAVPPEYTLSQPWVQNFGPMGEPVYAGSWAEVVWLTKR